MDMQADARVAAVIAFSSLFWDTLLTIAEVRASYARLFRQRRPERFQFGGIWWEVQK